MDIKQYKPILLLFGFSIIVLLIHKLVFFGIGYNQVETKFVYTLTILYSLFFLLSTVILLILIKINQVSKTHVGLVFIMLTTFKMGVAYVILKPVLKTNLSHMGFEKFNFLVVFLLFLTIETLITIQIINNKQQ